MQTQTPAMTTRQRNKAQHLAEVEESFRKRFYELAGIDEQELADSLRAAFNTTKAKLTATKTELVTYQGDYQAVEVVDNQTQLRAAEQIYDLTGVSVGKQERGGGGSVIVQVNFPSHHLPSPVTLEATAHSDESAMSEKNQYVNSQPGNK